MEISNKNEIYKGDFDTMVELRGLETYTAGQIATFIKAVTDNISKSEGSEAEAEELVKAEFEDLTQWVVVNDKFEKEIVFTRSPIMEKGVYKDNAINRKLGRVGQHFKEGGKKEEAEKKPAEKKKEDTAKIELKDKVIARLIKNGNNPEDVKKMVDKHFDYASKHYGTEKAIAEAIRTIY